MGKRNIGILINSLGAGGAERVISRISKPLAEYYNIYILLLEADKIAYEYTGKICNVGGNYKSYYGKVAHAIHCINKIVKEENIECIISFLDVPNLINVLAVHHCNRIINLRCYYDKKIYKGIVSRVKLEFCRHFFKRADGVITVSQALQEYSIQYLKLDKNKVRAIENTYNVDEIITKSGEDIETKVKSFILAHKTSVSMGRLDSQKGYPLLLRSFARVCNKVSDAGLIILGEGEKRKELENLAVDLGISDRVLFLGVKKNPFAYIAKCQVYVSASLYEGFPNALVEAMACAVPVIQTDCLTGPREILSETYTEKDIKEPEYTEYGILMPDFNRADKLGLEINKLILEYADTWETLLEDIELQRKYGIMAQKRARNYTIEKCINKYCEAIEMITTS